MRWKRLRRSLWRRADWSVVRGEGTRWNARLPNGRFISKHEFEGDLGHGHLSDAQCADRAQRFRSADEAKDWLDAHHPTDDTYPDREG